MKKKALDPVESAAQPDFEVLRPRQISEADIAQRAYEIYQRRAGGAGTDLDDWLQAEREISQEAPPLQRAVAAAIGAD